MSNQKYDVILADPPWNFAVWNKDKSPNHVSHKYDVMDKEEIGALDIPSLCAENCALFMWVTWPTIQDAFYVADKWGFTYRTEAWVWVKAKRSGFGFHFGNGYYTRASTEACLLFVKETMPVAVHDVQALIYTPVREHSRKPDEQYGKIQRLYPDARKLELFARRKHSPDWDVWGNEVESDVTF